MLRQGGTWPPPPTISVRALLTSNMSNMFNGQSFNFTQPADYGMPVDPCHEFPCVTVQLCGQGVVYASGSGYPTILNSGFVASYATNGGQSNPAEIMKCYSPSQLPVLNALAQEFVVCDNWHASMPGPTWPNRFFAHAASSGGLDHSPSTGEILKWDAIDGFSFANGTIFDRLNNNNLKWRLYAGDDFPMVGALKGIGRRHRQHKVYYSDFASDVAQAEYPASYTFIEPSYGHLWSDFKCGTSQHPLDDVTRGGEPDQGPYVPGSSELATLEQQLDHNHMGRARWIYDHVPPPPAVAPGDTVPGGNFNQYAFTFEQYGPRVPAVVISPLVNPNLIEHRVYDHSSIPATLETRFGLNPMTQRDTAAQNLMPLVSLSSPRQDTPTTLPTPVQSGITGCDQVSFDLSVAPPPSSRLEVVPYDVGLILSMKETCRDSCFVVLRSDLALSTPDKKLNNCTVQYDQNAG